MNAHVHTGSATRSEFLPAEIIDAFARALREELDAGRSVRIRKLGMWTPYTGGSGRQTVVFHSEINLRKGNGNEMQTDTPVNTADIDIPFVDGSVQAHKARQPQSATAIDVQLLFDEVCEEFGYHLSAGNAEREEGPERPPSAPEPEIPRQDEQPETASSESDGPSVPEEAPPEAMDEEDIRQSEAVFRMNRERLFNPPEPRQSNPMRKAAWVMTALMFLMLGYMAYTSGLFNGFLPDSMDYRPPGLERRSAPALRQGAR